MAVSVTAVLSDPAKAMLTACEVIIFMVRTFGCFLPDSIIWVRISGLMPCFVGRTLGSVERRSSIRFLAKMTVGNVGTLISAHSRNRWIGFLFRN